VTLIQVRDADFDVRRARVEIKCFPGCSPATELLLRIDACRVPWSGLGGLFQGTRKMGTGLTKGKWTTYSSRKDECHARSPIEGKFRLERR
jgi:hypothetical protein